VRQLDGATYGLTLLGGEFDLAAFAVGGADPEPAIAGLRSTHPLASLDSATADQAIQEGREAADEAGRKAAYDRLTAEMDDLHRFLWMNENHAWAVVGPDATGLTTNGQGTPWFERFGLVA
jgi:ABC-type transport system substrate-binding protein